MKVKESWFGATVGTLVFIDTNKKHCSLSVTVADREFILLYSPLMLYLLTVSGE